MGDDGDAVTWFIGFPGCKDLQQLHDAVEKSDDVIVTALMVSIFLSFDETT